MMGKVGVSGGQVGLWIRANFLSRGIYNGRDKQVWGRPLSQGLPLDWDLNGGGCRGGRVGGKGMGSSRVIERKRRNKARRGEGRGGLPPGSVSLGESVLVWIWCIARDQSSTFLEGKQSALVGGGGRGTVVVSKSGWDPADGLVRGEEVLAEQRGKGGEGEVRGDVWAQRGVMELVGCGGGSYRGGLRLRGGITVS